MSIAELFVVSVIVIISLVVLFYRKCCRWNEERLDILRTVDDQRKRLRELTVPHHAFDDWDVAATDDGVFIAIPHCVPRWVSVQYGFLVLLSGDTVDELHPQKLTNLKKLLEAFKEIQHEKDE